MQRILPGSDSRQTSTPLEEEESKAYNLELNVGAILVLVVALLRFAANAVATTASTLTSATDGVVAAPLFVGLLIVFGDDLTLLNDMTYARAYLEVEGGFRRWSLLCPAKITLLPAADCLS